VCVSFVVVAVQPDLYRCDRGFAHAAPPPQQGDFRGREADRPARGPGRAVGRAHICHRIPRLARRASVRVGVAEIPRKSEVPHSVRQTERLGHATAARAVHSPVRPIRRVGHAASRSQCKGERYCRSAKLDAPPNKSKRQTQKSTVKGQKSTVNGQRSTVKGQRSKVKGQRSTVKGQRSTVKHEANATPYK
jgi:hypothetical protein